MIVAETDHSALEDAVAAGFSDLPDLATMPDLAYRERLGLPQGVELESELEARAAQKIGLVPSFPKEITKRIGNAAIEGATIALLSATRRREIEALVKGAIHVELETDESFFDHFVEGCQFKPVVVGGATESMLVS